MNIAKNNHNNLCFYFNFLLLTAVIFTTEPAFSASPDGEPSEKKRIYIEDLVLDWLKDDNHPPQLDEIGPLLGYVVYEEIYAKSYPNPKNYTKEYYSIEETNLPLVGNVVSFFDREVRAAQERIYQKAVLNYLTKYGPNRPVIKKEEVAAFKKRAEKGDIQAIWELRRYYEHPDTENYNPEQTEARFWLFKAIEAGDEAAMLEAGYDRPYTVRTKLSYRQTAVILDAHCEKIDQSGSRPRPACFLFNLVISDQPKVVGHIILDQDHLSGRSLTPKELALKRINGQVMVELTSYADFDPDLKRRDYFDLTGRYVGRSGADFFADYFWNYHQAGHGDQAPILKVSRKHKELSRVP
ncbi:MAG: hypothetical protein LBP22_09015, partial [Deltaproteobacteria bacterium]|nr:hypothetical protein [Deltaproteobacteria bacterium]